VRDGGMECVTVCQEQEIHSVSIFQDSEKEREAETERERERERERHTHTQTENGGKLKITSFSWHVPHEKTLDAFVSSLLGESP